MKAVWAALIAIASTTGTTSIAIQIWTGTTFRSSADVVPIGEPFVAPDVRDAQPWCYVRDPAEPKRRSRRYYLVKAVAKSVTGYLFELERRVAQSDQRPLTETERFRGLAFTLDGSVGIQDLITTICARATESKGVLADSVTLHGFRKALLYNHRFDKQGTLNTTVRRVLAELGIAVPADTLDGAEPLATAESAPCPAFAADSRVSEMQTDSAIW